MASHELTRTLRSSRRESFRARSASVRGREMVAVTVLLMVMIFSYFFLIPTFYTFPCEMASTRRWVSRIVPSPSTR